MQDTPRSLEKSLAGLDKQAWKAELAKLAEECGMFQPLGDKHFATFIEDKNTLLVTFETVDGIRTLSEDAQPLGFDMIGALGWSHLAVISDGDTWFRDPLIYGFFDRLIDDGFFEGFEKIVFYGAGPCGYAAAAYSVAAPGATVIAIQPQATLDPRMTEWDERFPEMRRTSFTDRYGYAPQMLEAAEQAYILYDPREDLDAMHSALFERANVTRLRLPMMGGALQTSLIDMHIVYRMIVQAGQGKFSERAFYRMYRARRDYPPYLRNVLARLDRDERETLSMALCRNVTSRMHAPKFGRRLVQLERAKAN
ncbi:phosphoadenosine phosphosulfate reductase [Aestuariivita sp.]|jgi:hypothetical protein|uniref:phosphoadenosine phosphosulfate reductase n=1 Tax=Aestuariivita sp. TaxID=1872407 RepID=UPI00216EDC65|nr:phosphoadenosine phosphosulfate reductase [Aestuariivita sp.]MCE8008779.1 phosphoadenosine phosphosulfate reductase [Aestuariivita sp.]